MRWNVGTFTQFWHYLLRWHGIFINEMKSKKRIPKWCCHAVALDVVLCDACIIFFISIGMVRKYMSEYRNGFCIRATVPFFPIYDILSIIPSIFYRHRHIVDTNIFERGYEIRFFYGTPYNVCFRMLEHTFVILFSVRLFWRNDLSVWCETFCLSTQVHRSSLNIQTHKKEWMSSLRPTRKQRQI